MGSLIHSNSQTSPYAAALSPQEGVDQYLEDLNRKADIYHQQQTLAQALQGQMNGTGPNPAQTQFLANQQANVANAQGLIASQRGLNPALAARMGANAATQGNQQSALGAALLQQQQQLAATNQLGGLYGQLQQGNLNYLGEQNQVAGQSNELNQKTNAQNTQNTVGLIGGLINSGGGVGAAAATPGPAALAAHGAVVPGKPAKGPDRYENDNVLIKAQPGEIIVPNSKSHDPEKAKAFIDHLLKGKKPGGDYKDVLEARRKRKAA